MPKHLGALRNSSFMLFMSLSLMGCVEGARLDAPNKEILDHIDKNSPEIDGVEQTLLKSAKRASGLGEYEKATQLYAQLLEMDHANKDYQIHYADGLRHMQDFDGADQLYQLILKENPKSIDAKEGRALTKLAQGNFASAGTLLAEIHKEDKKRWRTLNALGIVLVERGQLEDAVAYFKAALREHPDYPALLNNIGLATAMNGNVVDAANYLTRGAQAAPTKSAIKKQIQFNLALIKGISGDMQGAEFILKDLLPEAGVANNLGFYAHLAKNNELAKSYLNTALTKSPYHYQRAWENLNSLDSTTPPDGKPKGSHSSRKVVHVPNHSASR
ncbi:MAG: tetratricopeptide repeat protein [Alphaproteobacteria bacterium]|nr:MAG: tetratricopeptide repeat protein [Alphaproteobacteria bacterium]TAF75207.1 MAG: tetratricopeptide repeat protein [Alphaproteobacteria bacterium]